MADKIFSSFELISTISDIDLFLVAQGPSKVPKNISGSNLTNSIGVPPGCILYFGTTNAPTGFLICDGRRYLTSQFSRLYNAIGNNFNKNYATWTKLTGSGNTTSIRIVAPNHLLTNGETVELIFTSSDNSLSAPVAADYVVDLNTTDPTNAFKIVVNTSFSSSSGGVIVTPKWTTTFRLPDLRGEFIRGLDCETTNASNNNVVNDGLVLPSRGLDPNRGLGSTQQDTIGPISIPTRYTNWSTDWGMWWISSKTTVAAGLTNGFTGDRYNGNDSNFNAGQTRIFDGSLTVSSGTETRPHNVALLPCIKY